MFSSLRRRSRGRRRSRTRPKRRSVRKRFSKLRKMMRPSKRSSSSSSSGVRSIIPAAPVVHTAPTVHTVIPPVATPATDAIDEKKIQTRLDSMVEIIKKAKSADESGDGDTVDVKLKEFNEIYYTIGYGLGSNLLRQFNQINQTEREVFERHYERDAEFREEFDKFRQRTDTLIEHIQQNKLDFYGKFPTSSPEEEDLRGLVERTDTLITEAIKFIQEALPHPYRKEVTDNNKGRYLHRLENIRIPIRKILEARRSIGNSSTFGKRIPIEQEDFVKKYCRMENVSRSLALRKYKTAKMRLQF